MKRNPADDCIFVRRGEGCFLIIAFYVNDLLIACSDDLTLRATKV